MSQGGIDIYIVLISVTTLMLTREHNAYISLVFRHLINDCFK